MSNKNKSFQAPPEHYISMKGQWKYYFGVKPSTSRIYDSVAAFNYIDKTMYFKIIGSSPYPIEKEAERKIKQKAMCEALGVKKNISVLDTFKSHKKDGNYIVVFQFHCCLPTAPDITKLKEIEEICKTYSNAEE